MAKATAGMAPGPRIATVSLTSAGTYIATKSAAIMSEHLIKIVQHQNPRIIPIP